MLTRRLSLTRRRLTRSAVFRRLPQESSRLPRFLRSGVAVTLLASPAGARPPPPPPRLAALAVSTVGPDSGESALGPWAGDGKIRPGFDPETFHYAIRCDPSETLSVFAAAAGETAKVTLNEAPASRSIERRVPLRHDQDLAIVVSEGEDTATYVVHCVDRDFPEVWTAVRETRRPDGLLLVDPIYTDDNGSPVGFLAILDDNGVPRFHRRIRGWVYNFRWHAEHRMYSYTREFLHDRGVTATVLLDEDLRPVARPQPVDLWFADHHAFRLTDEGNYLFLIYHPAERDLSPYPDLDGEFPYSTAEMTRDSVIQEVSPDGKVVFQWNSWEREDGGPALGIPDCRWGLFWPLEYGHLNSLFLINGQVLASFRGCSQVLRIDRPSGRVVWQLGGAPPTVPDGRIHYRIVGDPEPAGFCGQHTAIEQPPGVVTLFDNGFRCPGADGTPDFPLRRRGARVVEYRLVEGKAVFSRHYRLLQGSPAGGAVQVLEEGRWLITWGRGLGRPNASAVEVDRAGRPVFEIALRGRYRANLYRAYREYGLRVPLNLR